MLQNLSLLFCHLVYHLDSFALHCISLRNSIYWYTNALKPFPLLPTTTSSSLDKRPSPCRWDCTRACGCTSPATSIRRRTSSTGWGHRCGLRPDVQVRPRDYEDGQELGSLPGHRLRRRLCQGQVIWDWYGLMGYCHPSWMKFLIMAIYNIWSLTFRGWITHPCGTFEHIGTQSLLEWTVSWSCASLWLQAMHALLQSNLSNDKRDDDDWAGSGLYPFRPGYASTVHKLQGAQLAHFGIGFLIVEICVFLMRLPLFDGKNHGFRLRFSQQNPFSAEHPHVPPAPEALNGRARVLEGDWPSEASQRAVLQATKFTGGPWP